MSEQTTGEIPKGIDATRVTEWYAANVKGAKPPLTFSIIASGHSNLTYRVTDAGGTRTVLRRPPLGAPCSRPRTTWDASTRSSTRSRRPTCRSRLDGLTLANLDGERGD